MIARRGNIRSLVCKSAFLKQSSTLNNAQVQVSHYSRAPVKMWLSKNMEQS
jgi:hypothetical protein